MTQMEAPQPDPSHPGSVLRFVFPQRMEHLLLIASFTILALTGLPQKFSSAPWALWMIDTMGGIESARVIHRVAAIVLMVETIYHFAVVSYKVYVRRVALTMLPAWQDAIDAVQAFGYNLRLLARPPQMGRYNFGEKAEYWAVIWGTVIMVITGFMLWNPIATTRFLPGEFIPAAKAAHGGEAILAVLSILTWHLWNVHVKHFNKSMFTGYMSRHEMETEHALELAEIEAGQAAPPEDEQAIRRRVRIFAPVVGVIILALLLGLVWFVTFEQTAITTVPRQPIEVVAPATPAFR
jgi:cytochrome b subunit of formate dehydrogenase